ncbi:sterol desaturase family protein [Sphingomonas flavalba]|uniref:sterol desaturase family protein n=1 Tax=Sphingomonas flavalba TaxID=2559804 RepID=UPI00109D8AA4|nr:sterol desaturase family protein [Sphingomonas flavalba]
MWSLAPDSAVAAMAGAAGHGAVRLLLAPASLVSLQSLLFAALLAALVTLARRRNARPVRLRVLARALLPRRLWRSASGRADIGLTLLNLLVFPLLFGWAMLSARAIERGIADLLPQGPVPDLPRWLTAGCATVVLFLAYEFAYWLDHYLSHRLPVLWRFHRIHHSAASLSPLTNFRVHPVDSIVFANIVAVATGTAAALLHPLFGGTPRIYVVDGRNVLMVVALYLLTHLLHTHLWVAPPAPFDRLFQSPAHHQLHHSRERVHFDRNFGGSLALFDWLFGTLLRPAAGRRPVLAFGVAGQPARHDLWTLLVGPLLPAPRRRVRRSPRPLPVPALKPGWHPPPRRPQVKPAT